jgi:hypothetical protein
VRRNIFYDNDMAGLNLSVAGYTRQDVRFNHVYHNVFFHNAYAAKGSFTPFLSGVSLTRYGRRRISDTVIMNNVFWRNNGERAISFYRVDPSQQLLSHNLLGDAVGRPSRTVLKETRDPLFVRDAAPARPLKPAVSDFQLKANSPCIDGGGFLTRTATGGQGPSIPVTDAGFFTDGYGIVAGDVIQLEGGAKRSKIAKIDYDKNVITIDGDAAWTKDQGVSQPFTGARPDVGAFEYAAAPPGA